jgi:hypothetical protein
VIFIKKSDRHPTKSITQQNPFFSIYFWFV